MSVLGLELAYDTTGLLFIVCEYDAAIASPTGVAGSYLRATVMLPTAVLVVASWRPRVSSNTTYRC